jgi:putative ABC transport system permease protein
MPAPHPSATPPPEIFSVAAALRRHPACPFAPCGPFGIMAYSVTLQTHELGVRMALGAQTGNILKLVLRRGLVLVGSGVLLGLVSSILSVRILRSKLWGVSAFDPWTLVLAPLAFLCVALLACYLPCVA